MDNPAPTQGYKWDGRPENIQQDGLHYLGDGVAFWDSTYLRWTILGDGRKRRPEWVAAQPWAEYHGPCPDKVERVEDPINSGVSDTELMALYAVRYAMGRMSYAVSDGQRFARYFGAKSKWLRGVLRRDLKEAVDLCDMGIPSLGHKRDQIGWRGVLQDLEAMDCPVSTHHDDEAIAPPAAD
jgi:hypothetical protein